MAILATNNLDWVLCFRGSDLSSPQVTGLDHWYMLRHDLWTDWLTNDLPQGIGINAKQYKWALKVVEEVMAAHVKDGALRRSLTFTGHSLGGGLAATASLMTGCVPTLTFNAAAVHAHTRQQAYNSRPEGGYEATNVNSDSYFEKRGHVTTRRSKGTRFPFRR